MVNVTIVRQDKDEATPMEIPQDGTIGLMKSLIEIDLQVPLKNQVLYLDDKPLNDDNLIVEDVGITDGSLLILVVNKTDAQTPQTNFANQNPMMNSEAMSRAFANMFRGNQASSSSSTNQLQNNYELMRKYQQAMSDPFNVEAQQFIEKSIKEQRVSDNLSLAHEYLPESFANVYMLYINVEVNKVKIQAFVDTGAQSTIMSYKCAQKCNLTAIIDERIQGIAKGVGTTRILGKIHLADLKIGSSYYNASFIILEDDKVDFLLGLDMLRRYQCSIDLKYNLLRIRDDSVPFLDEKDIEKPFTPEM